MALRGRLMSAPEDDTSRQLAPSRTAPARAVERGRFMWLASQGRPVAASAQELGRCPATVRRWLTGCHRAGLAGLAEQARSGRPATYTPAQVSEVIATSLTKPQELGLPCACWTRDRVQAYLREVKGIAMQRTRMEERLLAEGLRWRPQDTWCGERVDPTCAETRGPSRRSLRRRPRGVSSCVWRRWDRRAPRVFRARRGWRSKSRLSPPAR